MTGTVNVLLVETDELELREQTEQLLMDEYAVDSVGAIDRARVKLAEGPDALVLSSGTDTIGLLRQLRAGEIRRADSRLPVLVLGADDDSAAVRYYRAGADVALPSESSGLLVAAGLEALSRRVGPQETRVVRVGSLTVDREARTAQVDSRPVKLTRLEFDLLATLASEPRKTFTRAELTREMWGYDPGAAGPSRTVDSHAHRLRQKLEQAGADRSCRPFAASGGGSPDDQHPPARRYQRLHAPERQS
jgi:DNA-binding response OmpR family regulator